MLLDDAGGGVAGGVQRIEGEQRAADGDHLQQRSDRRELAIVVVKVETRQRHPGGVLDQRRGLVAQRAVAIGTANPLAVGGQRLPLLLLSRRRQPWLGIALQRRFQRFCVRVHHHPVNGRFRGRLVASGGLVPPRPKRLQFLPRSPG